MWGNCHHVRGGHSSSKSSLFKNSYRLGHIVVIFPNCPQSNQLVVISHGTQGRGRQPEVESIIPGAIWKILKRVQNDLNEHSMKCENLWCSIPQGKYQPLPIMDCHEKFIISIIVNHVIFLDCKFKGTYRISMGEMSKVFIKVFSYVLYLRVSILAVMERSRVCWKQDLLEVLVFNFNEFQFSEDFQQITPSASGSGAGLLFPMPKNSLLNDN